MGSVFTSRGAWAVWSRPRSTGKWKKTWAVKIEEMDAVKSPQMITQYGLNVTPTIVILVNDVVKERLEGVVHAEQLEAILKKYL